MNDNISETENVQLDKLESFIEEADAKAFRDDCKATIESQIFISDKPITLEKLQDLFEGQLQLSDIQEITNEIQEDYEISGKGIRLREVAGGLQFVVKAKYKQKIMEKNAKKLNRAPFSPASFEVLAPIALLGPISKTHLDKIKGVDCAHHLRTLIDRKLVAIKGRAEDELGRPTLYDVTLDFWELFGLNDRNDLPGRQELEALAEMQETAQVPKFHELLKNRLQLKVDEETDTAELLETDEQIKKISSDTEFTLALKTPSENRPALSELVDQFRGKLSPPEENAEAEENEMNDQPIEEDLSLDDDEKESTLIN